MMMMMVMMVMMVMMMMLMMVIWVVIVTDCDDENHKSLEKEHATSQNSGVGPTTTSADRGPLRVLRGGDEEETQIS